MKALHEVQKLRLKDTHFTKNQGILNLQVTLINFITSLETVHADIVHNLSEEILPDFKENQQIQKTYMSHYVGFSLSHNHSEIFSSSKQESSAI